MSTPAPPSRLSAPAPPSIVSAPAPPSRKSSSAPPSSRSSPSPPANRSWPLSPLRRSSPPPPDSVSFPFAPRSMSAPSPPVSVRSGGIAKTKSFASKSATRTPESVTTPPDPKDRIVLRPSSVAADKSSPKSFISVKTVRSRVSPLLAPGVKPTRVLWPTFDPITNVWSPPAPTRTSSPPPPFRVAPASIAVITSFALVPAPISDERKANGPPFRN